LILSELKDKLLEVDPVVYYGMVDDSQREMVWDYTVFERTKIAFNQNKNSRSYFFKVHIIRENFIPEGIELAVIEKVCEIPGMRVSGDPTFQYVPKPNTNVVIEIMSIDFVLAVKG